MKWQGRRQSSNVEDRRGRGGGGGGIGFGMAGVGGGLGLIIFIIVSLLGGNPGEVLNGGNPQSNTPYVETQQDQELAEFVSVVLADTEDVWTEVFNEYDLVYSEPSLVLFNDSVRSACGIAGSATGPFYCPGDQRVYIDLSFYKLLSERFHAPGDFAMAYVVAHEVGHHVQTLLGVTQKLDELRPRLTQEQYNQYSVRLELQADYLAGVWARRAKDKGLLERGDLEEALNAAQAIGDDTLQKQAQGYVVPESFTHGTSKQRKDWLYKGYNTGNLDEWDTFGAKDL